MASFDALLEETGKELKTSLKPDRHRSCEISCPNKIHVHMQPHPHDESLLLIACTIAELPPGKYGENIMQAALRANHVTPPYRGIFAFSKKKNSLVLCDTLSMATLTGSSFAEIIGLLSEKAQRWREAINSGVLPLPETPAAGALPPSPFGLR